MRKLAIVALLLALPCLAFGQGAFIPPQTSFKVVNGYIYPNAGATITVCAALASGIPCSPALVNTIYSNTALTNPLTNPFTADGVGNYQFAAAPGTYTVTETATGFTGKSYQISIGSGSSGGGVVGATPNGGLLLTSGTLLGLLTSCTPNQTEIYNGTLWACGLQIPITHVLNLTSVLGKQNGSLAVVTDGQNANDCTVGGGSFTVFCMYNGTTWAPTAGSGVSLSAGTGISVSPNPITGTGTISNTGCVPASAPCALPTGSTAVTQALGDNSTDIATDAFANAAVNNVAGYTYSVVAKAYGVTANTKFIFDATLTSSSNAITCTTQNDCNFTAADNNKLCWATNLPKTGYQAMITSVLILGEGQISETGAQAANCIGYTVPGSISSGTFSYDEIVVQATSGASAQMLKQIVSGNTTIYLGIITGTADATHNWVGQTSGAVFAPSGAPVQNTSSANCTGSSDACVFVWGTDDTTAMQSAWTATLAVCGALQLPAGNMIVQTGQWNGSGSPSCFLSVGGSRQGVGLHGIDISTTRVIPSANFAFNTTSCPGTTTINSGTYHMCFANSPDGMNMSDLSIWGSGISNPSSVANALASYIAVSVASANNAYIHDVSLIAWGAASANSGGIGYGALIQAGSTQIDRFENDGFGAIGFVTSAGGSGSYLAANKLFSGDNATGGLWVTQSISCLGCAFGAQGSGGNTGTCQVGITGGAQYISTGGQYTGGGAQICAGADPLRAVTTQTGSAILEGDHLIGAGCSGCNILFIDNSGSYIRIMNSVISGSNSSNGIAGLWSAGAVLYDGGNNFINISGLLTNPSPSGTVIGAGSITGTAITAGAAVLNAGWGSTAAWSGLNGYNNFTGTITNSGTGQAASPTITYTFPNIPSHGYWVAPLWCTATQVGGTNPTGTFTASSLTAAGVTFTYSLTPTASDTEIVQISCQVPQ